MIPKNIHEAVLQVKNDHIKRLENAIRALVENFDVDLLLSRIRQGTTAEELLETERDALRARVVKLEEALREIRDYDAHKHPDESIIALRDATIKESNECTECQHAIWGHEGSISSPLVYLQRPKWIKSDAAWQKIVESVQLNLPRGFEVV